jgi:hypothetical protein
VTGAEGQERVAGVAHGLDVLLEALRRGSDAKLPETALGLQLFKPVPCKFQPVSSAHFIRLIVALSIDFFTFHCPFQSIFLDFQ